eukprot:SAG11_NODE_6738_length_1257_cov_0.838515_1_plen_207_part_00
MGLGCYACTVLPSASTVQAQQQRSSLAHRGLAPLQDSAPCVVLMHRAAAGCTRLLGFERVEARVPKRCATSANRAVSAVRILLSALIHSSAHALTVSPTLLLLEQVNTRAHLYRRTQQSLAYHREALLRTAARGQDKPRGHWELMSQFRRLEEQANMAVFARTSGMSRFASASVGERKLFGATAMQTIPTRCVIKMRASKQVTGHY